MNGRIYDPVIGRFLSADTFVQDAGDLQAYNRYSYVRNNPTSLNDPSGHFWSAVITAGFAAYDTYQYATGKQTGAEYARNMAVNGAALVADVATLGQGGGLGVRAAQVAARSEKAIVAIKNVAETIQKVDAVVSKAESAAHAVQAAASGDTKGALLAASGVISGGGKATAAESKLEKNAVKAGQQAEVSASKAVAKELQQAEAGVAKQEAKAVNHGHHSDPKFMGGDPKQPLTQMPASDHKELHKDLNDHLAQQSDEFGNHMRPQAGNSGAQIRENFSREERLDALADFYSKNAEKYSDAAADFFKQHPELQKK